MESKRENAFVGLFTLVAAALLVFVVFLLSGTFGQGNIPYRAYFKNAGGLSPGAEVRYAGGPPIGRVRKVQSDPADATRMEVDFDVDPSVPVKTDSIAEITSVSPLGNNFLGVRPGSLGDGPPRMPCSQIRSAIPCQRAAASLRSSSPARRAAERRPATAASLAATAVTNAPSFAASAPSPLTPLRRITALAANSCRP